VQEGYSGVVLKVNNVEKRIGKPDGNGWYCYTISEFTNAAAIEISAVARQLNVALSYTGQVTPFGISAGTKQVSYGGKYPLAFYVEEGYRPVLRVNNVEQTLGAPIVGLYRDTVYNITTATSIHISASILKFDVTLSCAAEVKPASGTSAGTKQVSYGGSYLLAFRMTEGYLPVLMVNGVEKPLGSPDATGLYRDTVRNITAATTISISAALRSVNVTLSYDVSTVAPTEGTSAGVTQVGYSKSFPFAFEVADGYLPVLKVNGVERPVGNPDANGIYRDTVRNVKAETTVEISTIAKPNNDSKGNSTGVEEYAADAPRFYPNPASDVLTFENTDKVSIYTVTGTLVGVYTTSTVSIAHLPAGVYVVKMQKDNYIKTEKLVKN
jgi:hypothetical protein